MNEPTNDAPVTVERELQPCPHCGNERIGMTSIRDGYEVWCKCGATMQAHNPNARQKAIDQWNMRHRLAALASAPAPSWSETPEHIRDHLALLAEVELHLQSSRVFVTTREKMHPCGVELHDELLGKVTAAIETIGKGQAHG